MGLFIKKNGNLQQVAISHNVMKVEENVAVELNMADGNQTIDPTDASKVMKQAKVYKPSTLIPENIKSGVSIGGVTGTYPDYLENRLNGNDAPYNYENNNITTLRSRAFYFDENIRELKLNAVTTIQNGQNCFVSSGLTKIEMPSVTIATSGFQMAFNGCANLRVAKFPSLTNFNLNVQSLFMNCVNLVEVDFSSLQGLHSDNRSFFYGCTSLQTIDLNEAGCVPSYTFAGCTSLTDVTLRREATSLQTVVLLPSVDAFSNIGHQVTIHVPSSLISAYQTATNWSTLYNNGDITFVAIQ